MHDVIFADDFVLTLIQRCLLVHNVFATSKQCLVLAWGHLFFTFRKVLLRVRIIHQRLLSVIINIHGVIQSGAINNTISN